MEGLRAVHSEQSSQFNNYPRSHDPYSHAQSQIFYRYSPRNTPPDHTSCHCPPEVGAGFLGAHSQEEGLATCYPEEVDPYASVVEKVSLGVDQTVLLGSNDTKRCRNGVGEGCDYDYDHGLDGNVASVTGKVGKRRDMGCWI